MSRLPTFHLVNRVPAPVGTVLLAEFSRLVEDLPRAGTVSTSSRLGTGAIMSILDKMKDKAGELARTHGDKVVGGLDKAAEAVNRRTEGKHADKLANFAERAKGAVGDLAEGPRRRDDYGDPPPAGPVV